MRWLEEEKEEGDDNFNKSAWSVRTWTSPEKEGAEKLERKSKTR